MNLHGKIFDKKSQFHIETLDKGVNMATVVVLNLAQEKRTDRSNKHKQKTHSSRIHVALARWSCWNWGQSGMIATTLWSSWKLLECNLPPGKLLGVNVLKYCCYLNMSTTTSIQNYAEAALPFIYCSCYLIAQLPTHWKKLSIMLCKWALSIDLESLLLQFFCRVSPDSPHFPHYACFSIQLLVSLVVSTNALLVLLYNINFTFN